MFSFSFYFFFFFSSRRRHTRFKCDWSSDVCSSDLTVTMYSFASYPSNHVETGQFSHEFFCVPKEYIVTVGGRQEQPPVDGAVRALVEKGQVRGIDGRFRKPHHSAWRNRIVI